MSFTYGNAPATSDRDAVRVLLNDITESTEKLSDETISWLIGQHSNVYFAAAAGAEIIAGQLSDAVTDKQVGDLRTKSGGAGTTPAEQYRALAKQMRHIAVTRGVSGFTGGITISGKQSEESDTDRPQPAVEVGMDDNDSYWGSYSTSGRWHF